MGECQWERGRGWREIKGRKKWDNCNSIINKIYLKKEREMVVCVFYVLVWHRRHPDRNKI